MARGLVLVMIVDAHVHFWDPTVLSYPWLDGSPALRRAYLPSHYAAGAPGVVDRLVFVEANCAPDQCLRELEFVEQLAAGGAPVAAVVAYADVTEPTRLEETLGAFARFPRVRGVRQNIQGERPGFCLQPSFGDGVRRVAAWGYTFDLCATHDQLADVLALVRACPHTRFVLDHCGKPAVRDRLLEPWRSDLARLAEHDHVYCKLSGLLTEAAPGCRADEDLWPFASSALDCFGPGRLMYGSDWPVLTLAGSPADWWAFTRRFTASWCAADRDRFYGGTAAEVYGL